jgi:hypothetical protein
MNNLIKEAYDRGVLSALVQFGLVKQSAVGPAMEDYGPTVDKDQQHKAIMKSYADKQKEQDDKLYRERQLNKVTEKRRKETARHFQFSPKKD